DGRPFPGWGYTGSIRAHSSRHGTTRSISARNCARRVTFVYFSNPVLASVGCERVIATSRSRVRLLVASQHTSRESGGLIQSFPKRAAAPRGSWPPHAFNDSGHVRVELPHVLHAPSRAVAPHGVDRPFEAPGHPRRVPLCAASHFPHGRAL